MKGTQLLLSSLLLHWGMPLAHAVAHETPGTAKDSAEASSADTRESAQRAALEDTAGGESAPLVAAARSHFLRGVQLYRSEAYDAALAEFSRAYESAPNYRILYNLAQIQAQRHDYVEALKLFRRYVADGAGDVAEARVSEVEAEISELEQRISRLRVETNTDDARLFINDTWVGVLPQTEPLLVNAGIYRVRAEKAGYISAWRVVTLTGGDDLTLNLELSAEIEIDPPLTPPSVSAAPVPAPRRSVDRTALWTSLATTGALTGACLSFGFVTGQANARLDRLLATYPAPRDSIDRSRARVRNLAALTDAFGVAAATALGFSAYFYLSGRPEGERGPLSGLQAVIDGKGSRLSWGGHF
jgi:PEGA domain-containing protein